MVGQGGKWVLSGLEKRRHMTQVMEQIVWNVQQNAMAKMRK